MAGLTATAARKLLRPQSRDGKPRNLQGWAGAGIPISGFPGGLEVKASAWNSGSIPGSGRSPGEGNGNPLQYSCLENPMEGGAWWAAVYGVAQSWARLKQLSSSSSSLSLLQGIFPIQGLNPCVQSTSQLTANKEIAISDLPQGTGLFYQQ